MRTKVKTALASVGCPVYWMKWKGQGSPPATYITFSRRERDDHFGDDLPQEMAETVYVEIWSDGDSETIYTAVKAAMKGAGFVLTDSVEIDDGDSYHTSMTYNYVGLD